MKHTFLHCFGRWFTERNNKERPIEIWINTDNVCCIVRSRFEGYLYEISFMDGSEGSTFCAISIDEITLSDWLKKEAKDVCKI